MAAALFESLSSNHAFHDRNEHMALFCADVFLRLNAWRLQVDADGAIEFISQLKEAGQNQRAALLRKSIVPLPN